MESKFWIGLSAIEQLDAKFFRAIYEYFGSAERAFNASLDDLKNIDGLTIRKVDNFLSKRDSINPV